MFQSLNFLIGALLAIGAGMSVVVQQAINANLRAGLNSAAWAGIVSYLVGTLCMLVLAVVMRDSVPTATTIARTSWWAWTGGFFGAVFIGLAIVLVPRLGTATFIALLVAGQMIASMAIDHFGLFGISEHPLNGPRLVGALLLVAAVILIRR